MKKIRQLFIFALCMMLALSALSVTAFASGSFFVDVQVNEKTDTGMLEVVVYGENMKGINTLELNMHYDKAQLESGYEEILIKDAAAMKMITDTPDNSGKMLLLVLNNDIRTDEKIKLFRINFKPLTTDTVTFSFSENTGLVLDGKTEFEFSPSETPMWGENGIFKYMKADGEVTITDCVGYPEGDVVISAEIDGCPVTVIGDNVFTYNAYVTSVVIPDTVHTIEHSAFHHCDNLKDFYIPASVNEIHGSAIGWINGEMFDKSITIHGAKGSVAEKYATEKGMFFHECSEYHKTEEFSLADVNADGNITAADARLALRAAAKLETLTPAQFSAADIMRNSAVNAADARIILRIAAKIESVELYR